MNTYARKITLGDWRFNRIELRDKELYAQYIKDTQYPADLWSSNFDYLWATSNQDSELILWKIIDNMLVTFKLTKNQTLQIAFPPFGQGDSDKVAKVLLKCMKFCYQWNKKDAVKTRIRAVTKQQLEFLQTSSLFNKNFHFKKLTGVDRHLGVKKMIELSGKEFKEVRQNRNRFLRNYPEASVRRAKSKDYYALLKLKRAWNHSFGQKYSRIWDDQFFEKIIRHYQELNHIILVVEYKGKLIGTVTGGILPHGQAWSAFLKRLDGYDGLSEFLNVEFAREIHKVDPQVELINIGIDFSANGGLREFKDKFRPVVNSERYRVYLNMN